MASNESIRREHDYVLDYIKIVDWKGNEYEFNSHFAEFTYEESIFAPPHGSIVCVDPVDYPTLLPIMGEERIKASFTRPDEKNPDTLLPSIKFDMQVYAMKARQQDQASKKRQVYTLKYISDTAIKTAQTRIFRAYKGKLYSDMVQDIYDNVLSTGKPLVIEPTLHEMDYLVTNDRPYSAIKKICTRAISSEDNGSLYTFYEDRDSFYFMTIAKMFAKAPTTTLRYEPKNLDKDETGLTHRTPDIEKDMYNVSQLDQSRGFDILTGATTGEAGSHLLSVNPTRRKFIEKEFDLRQEFDTFKHLEKNKRWTDSNKMFGDPKSNPNMIVSNIGNDTAPYISSHEPGIKPYFYEDYKLHRKSQDLQIMRYVTKVSLSGDPRVRAGDVIEFLLPEFMGKVSKENPEELDRYLQGKYLIVAVAHIIKQGSYAMHLELVKDTYYKELINRNPVDIYKDVY